MRYPICIWPDIGSGCNLLSNRSDIYIAYGDTPSQMVKTLLEKMDPLANSDRSLRIGIKPNLVVAKPADSGATTSPEVVEAIIGYLHSRGFRDICVMESSWVGEDTDRAFDVCGYTSLAKRTGVELVNLRETPAETVKTNGFSLRVFSRVLEVDYLINVPVLKAHCQTRITCALKNLKGCIPDSEKRRFHRLGLHEPIARLNTVIKANLIIVDALCGDLTFEEGGNPVRMDRIIGGVDPVAVDSYCARLIGIDPLSVDYIRLAEQLGVGRSEPASVIELGVPTVRHGGAVVGSIVAGLLRRVHQRQACSACLGSLVHALYRLKESGNRGVLNLDIHIGQGYRGVQIDGLGVGDCARLAAQNVPGCPPRAEDIVRRLQELKDVNA